MRKKKKRRIIIIIILEIYHITWNIPNSHEVQERLVQLEENSEKFMHLRLKEYRRYIIKFSS